MLAYLEGKAREICVPFCKSMISAEAVTSPQASTAVSLKHCDVHHQDCWHQNSTLTQENKHQFVSAIDNTGLQGMPMVKSIYGLQTQFTQPYSSE